MTTRVRKWGSGVAVIVPKTIATKFGLGKGTVVEMAIEGDSIVMRQRPGRARRSLKSLVAQIRPAAYARRRRERLDDTPVGKEVW